MWKYLSILYRGLYGIGVRGLSASEHACCRAGVCFQLTRRWGAGTPVQM